MSLAKVRQRMSAALSNPSVSPVPAGDLRPAAVLVPLFKDEGAWKVLFTKRTESVEHHKGQISFPGGVQDPEDIDLCATALRETEEEIGLARGAVSIVGAMDPIKTITNYLIHPFVGVIPYPYPFRLNTREVERLITPSLEGLIQEASSQQPRQGGLNLTFNRQGEVIWGATARILYRFLEAAFLNDKGG